MRSDYEEDNPDQESEMYPGYCEDCRILTEALREMEQQCREAEDEGIGTQFLIRCAEPEKAVDLEEAYLGKMAKLRRRRNAALEVLLTHQRLEHL